MGRRTDFWIFVRAGRTLRDLQVGNESIEPNPVMIKEGDLLLAFITDPALLCRVGKMTFGKGKNRSFIDYNPSITLTNLPLKVHDYVVNGKPTIAWMMERQTVKGGQDQRHRERRE